MKYLLANRVFMFLVSVFIIVIIFYFGNLRYPCVICYITYSTREGGIWDCLLRDTPSGVIQHVSMSSEVTRSLSLTSQLGEFSLLLPFALLAWYLHTVWRFLALTFTGLSSHLAHNWCISLIEKMSNICWHKIILSIKAALGPMVIINYMAHSHFTPYWKLCVFIAQ